jgi:branched-chain amino acid transport system ATP-binding protein
LVGWGAKLTREMVAIARGLMAQPKVLLLDEPSLGLAPLFVERILQIIAGIRGEGTTVLLRMGDMNY